mmetsp:Transcript_28459/g.83720  ORF Transcript_28459/g.83720 Transcript_28459/m.83720 type:complete len:418 (+) Transcript_28459:32-1285(+)
MRSECESAQAGPIKNEPRSKLCDRKINARAAGKPSAPSFVRLYIPCGAHSRGSRFVLCTSPLPGSALSSCIVVEAGKALPSNPCIALPCLSFSSKPAARQARVHVRQKLVLGLVVIEGRGRRLRRLLLRPLLLLLHVPLPNVLEATGPVGRGRRSGFELLGLWLAGRERRGGMSNNVAAARARRRRRVVARGWLCLGGRLFPPLRLPAAVCGGGGRIAAGQEELLEGGVLVRLDRRRAVRRARRVALLGGSLLVGLLVLLASSSVGRRRRPSAAGFVADGHRQRHPHKADVPPLLHLLLEDVPHRRRLHRPRAPAHLPPRGTEGLPPFPLPLLLLPPVGLPERIASHERRDHPQGAFGYLPLPRILGLLERALHPPDLPCRLLDDAAEEGDALGCRVDELPEAALLPLGSHDLQREG